MQRPAVIQRLVVFACVLAACAGTSVAQPGGQVRLGPVTTWRVEGRQVRATVKAGEGTAHISVSAVNPQVLRFQAALDEGQIEAGAQVVELEAAEKEGELVVWTPAVELRLSGEPLGLVFRNAAGQVLLDAGASDEGRAGGVSLGTNRSAQLTFATAPNEHFYGLGERYNALDQRGMRVQNWIQDVAASLGDASYVCVPFYISSRGYGLWLNSVLPSVWDFGATESRTGRVFVRDSRLDMYLIYGPEPRAILDRFTELTGRPVLPPRWAFLPWVSRDAYRTQEQVLDVARRMSELGLPCGVIVIEDWRDTGSWNFAPDRFPDPAAMFRELHELGIRGLLYVLPALHPRDPVFRDAAAGGFVVATPDGRPARLNSWLRGWALVDFTNPEAVRWWQGLHEPLLKLGADGFKLGDGEAVRLEMRFSDGRTGFAVHNPYPNLFHEAMFGVVRETVEDGGLVWARSGTTGVQRSACIWAGDQTSDFEHLRATVRAGLSAAMSGIPFWGHDIGGYWGRKVVGRQQPPTKELFIRWLQFGAFSPIMQLHGRDPREPWALGDEALSAYRRWAQLRANLLPYIYTCAAAAASRGDPIIQPLALAFPDDPRCAEVDDEYLFGPDLLVAPVCEEGATGRDLYLPPGVWFDFWENTVYDGRQTIHREADLSSIPLFVRAGAIIPMELAPGRSPGQSADAPPQLTFDVYPYGKSRGRLQEGDVLTEVTCERRGAQLRIDVGRRARPCWLRIFCSAPKSVEVDGKRALPEGRLADALSFWRYDNSTQRLLIRLGGKQATRVRVRDVPGPTIFANITFPNEVCSAQESIVVEADIFNLPVAAEPMLEWEQAGRPQPARTGIPLEALRWQFRIPVVGPVAQARSLRFRLTADVNRLTFPATTEKRRITLVPPVTATVNVAGSGVVGDDVLDVEVRLENHCTGESRGKVTLRAPEGAEVTPAASLPYTIEAGQGATPLRFTVRLPATLTIGEHEIAADVQWLDHAMGTARATITNEPTWAVIGPFPDDSGRGVAKVFPPEKKVSLREKVEGKGGPVEWRVYPGAEFGKDGCLDFLKAFPGQEWVVAYAVAYVESPSDREVEVRVGHDDGVVVWLNGEQLISRNVYQAARPDQAIAAARLRKGVNEILVKLSQGDRDWKLYFRLTGKDGLPMAGLRDLGPERFAGLRSVQVASASD